MTREHITVVPLFKARDPVTEPHDRSPRWLGEGKAAVWREVTPDDEGGKHFVPKKMLPCHGEAEQRLGYIRKSDGVEVAYERLCRGCREEEARRALEASFDAKANHEQRVREFFRRRGVPLVKTGANRGALVDMGPREPVPVNERDSTGIDYGKPQMVPMVDDD